MHSFNKTEAAFFPMQDNLCFLRTLLFLSLIVLLPSLLTVQEPGGACAPAVTGIELDSLITSVRDLLPDLGEGFIEVTWTLGV